MKNTTLRRAGAVVLVAAVAAAGATASASGHKAHAAAADAVIKMEYSKKKHSYFVGPKTVKAGGTLEIENTTSVMDEGPHTFSLIAQNLDKKQQKACEGEDFCPLIAGAFAKAHKVSVKGSGKNTQIIVGKHAVDVGKKGWDSSLSLDGKTMGDSWYSEKQNETTTRKVTAPAGTTLHYFCAVHPFMEGTIKVVK